MGKRKSQPQPKSVAGGLKECDRMFWSLPFVRPPWHKGEESCWTLAVKGGYHGGCITGEHAAIAYLKCMREFRKVGYLTDGDGGLGLQSIVLDMVGIAPGKTAAEDALRGQIVGFFSYIDEMLCASISSAHHLDKISMDEVLEGIRKGIDRRPSDDEADEAERAA